MELRVAQDIIPLSRFKSHASQILGELRREGRPVVITQNGKPAAVLVTPQEFDRIQGHGRFMAAVSEGLTDVEAGRVVPDSELELEE